MRLREKNKDESQIRTTEGGKLIGVVSVKYLKKEPKSQRKIAKEATSIEEEEKTTFGQSWDAGRLENPLTTC